MNDIYDAGMRATTNQHTTIAGCDNKILLMAKIIGNQSAVSFHKQIAA